MSVVVDVLIACLYSKLCTKYIHCDADSNYILRFSASEYNFLFLYSSRSMPLFPSGKSCDISYDSNRRLQSFFFSATTLLHCYTAFAMEDNHPLKHVSPRILSLLSHLHAQSSAQESQLTPADYALATIDSTMHDKMIALEQDKCYFIYQLAISINAKTIVEAGTSYGLSTIYLALAAASNVEASGGSGRVIGTEHEHEKAIEARKNWDECSSSVSNIIDLREGDLRETLKQDLGSVDMLLLDSK